jgi:LysM repeat protein
MLVGMRSDVGRDAVSVSPEAVPSTPDRGLAGSPPDDIVHAICPYLGTGEGWRLAVPDRVHRCLAVDPPVPLALEKQRRLCLDLGHVRCATHEAAVAALQGAMGGELRIGAAGTRAPRWPVPRTVSTVLDVGRGSVDVRAAARGRAATQVALVLLALLAFGSLILVRVGGGLPTDVRAGAIETPTNGVVGSPVASPAVVATQVAVEPSAALLPSPTAASSASTPTASPVPSSSRRYTVRAGDTLNRIASRFGTTVKAIEAANGIVDPSRLQIGQVLEIP